MQDDFPALAHNAIHHIGLHQFPAVHRRTNGGYQLNRRYGDALPKADTGKGILRHIFLMGYDAAGLSRDPAGRRGPKAKRIDIIIKGIHTHPERHLHESWVARILHGLFQRLASMAASLPAFNPLPVDYIIARAIKAGCKIHRPAIQCRRKG
ncbi:hypothetical protein SDC9_197836 [bioreactor metagenome]|uniref:Uncharacterized protein n=1 Tax=bioreactor metagenome TaxID=1076179 RepID=A0A645IGH5_9ZZZZ